MSSKPENAEIDQLIDLVKSGDEVAFKKLVHHHYNLVYRTAFGILRNEENTKEVTQTVWIKVWNKISTFKGDSAFTTWIYRITTFASLDYIRSQKKHRKVDSIEASEENEGIKSIQPASDYSGDQPLESLKKQEIMNAFKRALNTLSESHRTALSLREIEGLSYEEIASIMDCKIGTVMSRIFHARKAIQKEMGEFK
ncbi:MAG: sigma-70 family RNA polymerase sigma factor [Opitutales bacterium]|nr:sigma-70 family RNA polymerase sigma factor [Opitutales bacterium]